MSTNASFGISICGFRWRAPVLKHEWIFNCTPPTKLLEKRIDVTHRSNFTSSASMEFILNFEIRIKLTEPVPFPKIKLFLLHCHCYLRRSPIGQLLNCYKTGYNYPVLSHSFHWLSYRQLAFFPEAKPSSTFLSFYSLSLTLVLKIF